MNPSEPLCGDQLLEMLQRRLRTIESLMQCCLEQERLIESGQMGDLMRLLSRKDPLVRQLQDESAAIVAGTARTVRYTTDHPREESVQTRDAGDKMLREILQREQRCETRLQSSRDDLDHRLASFAQSATAGTAYRANDGSADIARGGNVDLRCD